MVKTLPARCEVNRTTGAPRIVIATEAVDSERDRAQIRKMRVRIPLRVTLNHDYRELPIGQVDRREQIHQDAHRMVAEFRWLEGDERAARARNAYEQGMLDGSVGVRVEGSEPNEFGGRDYWGEVVEFALTPLPANAECVALVRSLFASVGAAAGLTLDDDEAVLTLDDEALVLPPDLASREALKRYIAGVLRAEVEHAVGLRMAAVRDAEDVLGDLDADALREVLRVVVGEQVRAVCQALKGNPDYLPGGPYAVLDAQTLAELWRRR